MILSRTADFGSPTLAVSLWRDLRGTGLLSWQGASGLLAWGRANPIAGLKLVAVLGAIAAAGAAVVWVSVVAQGALVHAVAVAGAGRRMSIGASWAHGRKKFWPLLGCAALAKAAVTGVFWAVGRLVALPAAAFSAAFVLGCLFVLGIAVAWKYAAAAVVLENRPVISAWRQARRLLRQRWADSIHLAGALTLLTVAAAAALLIAVFLISIPFNVLLGTAVLIHYVAGGKIYFYLSWLTIVGIVAFVALVVTCMHWAAWTTAFVEEEKDQVLNPKS